KSARRNSLSPRKKTPCAFPKLTAATCRSTSCALKSRSSTARGTSTSASAKSAFAEHELAALRFCVHADCLPPGVSGDVGRAFRPVHRRAHLYCRQTPPSRRHPQSHNVFRQGKVGDGNPRDRQGKFPPHRREFRRRRQDRFHVRRTIAAAH